VDTCKRRHAMKIIVSMDEHGWIVAKNAQGDILEECFFKTDDETDEEIRAWGYQRLVHAYPAAQIAAGEETTHRRLKNCSSRVEHGTARDTPQPMTAMLLECSQQARSW
jgi:hypothetical protein